METGKGTQEVPIKWYYKPVSILIAILAAGPFAIPLVLLSPAFKKWQKAVITALVILLTVWMVKTTSHLAHTIQQQMQELQAIMR